MKREKIYSFAIDHPLTPAKRKAVERHLKANVPLSPSRVSWEWDDPETLHILAHPVQVDVRFKRERVELFAAAPLWARLLFTKQRKAELKEQIQAVLLKTKFVSERKPGKAAPVKNRKQPSRKPKRSSQLA